MVVGFYKKLRWVAREFLSFLAPSSQWQSVATALLFQYLQKRVPQNDNKKIKQNHVSKNHCRYQEIVFIKLINYVVWSCQNNY